MPSNLEPTWTGQVMPEQIDPLGHMNVQHYIAAVSHGVFKLLERAGLDRETSTGHGVHIAGAHMSVDFFRECWPGERLMLLSALTQVRESSVLFVHELLAGDEQCLAMRCHVRGVCIGVGERRSRPIPESLKARLNGFVVRVPSPESPSDYPQR